jgi:hypothetical protein
MMRQRAQQWQPQVIWCETSEPSRQYAPPLVHFPARTPATHYRSPGLRESLVRPGFTGCDVPVDRRQRMGESVPLLGRVLACFDRQWPNLILAVA